MNYPIHYSYSRHDGGTYSGLAPDVADAVAAMRAMLADGGADDADLPTAARLVTVEAGSTCRTQAEVEQAWSAEIQAGWASVIHVYNGYRAIVLTWDTYRKEG